MTTQLLSGDSQNTSLLSLASDGTQRTGSVDPYGAEPAVNAGTFPLGYTGQRIDPLTGDYPMGNGYRHYSPGMRCFRSQDSWSPFGPGGVNGYAYVGGNPIDHTDPSGHMSVRAGIRIGFGLLRLTIMGAMAIFTGGASLGLVAGESAARRGLRLASGAVRATSAALQIASGATLDGDPELSADLGWAAMATGIVGGIAGRSGQGKRVVLGDSASGGESVDSGIMGSYGSHDHDVLISRASLDSKLEASVIPERMNDFEYFYDKPDNTTGNIRRLNIVGHGDRGTSEPIFQGDWEGAPHLTSAQLAEQMTPLLNHYDAPTIRLVACKSGATGFAQTLANNLQKSIEAPLTTITKYRTVRDPQTRQIRFVFLRKWDFRTKTDINPWRIYHPGN